ncbi:MAG: hypothetical protein ACREOU_02805 [Candidatus Eiseniibacteriota bacterium]
MNCVEAIDRMADDLEGHLNGLIRPEFEAHLVACGPCRRYRDQLGLTLRAIQQLRNDTATSPQRSALIDRFRKEWKSAHADD